MRLWIQVKAPDEFYCKVPHVVMHQVKHTHDCRKRRNTLDGLEGSDCMQSASPGHGM